MLHINRGLWDLFGDVGCFSFNGNKIITTGGGGMLVTDHDEWARKARYLTTQAKDDPIEYIHGEVGYNYRLTNLLAAVGCAQMEQLPAYVAAKRNTAARYTEKLRNVPGVQPMRNASWAESTFWMYTILVEEGKVRYGCAHIDEFARIEKHSVQAAVAANSSIFGPYLKPHGRNAGLRTTGPSGFESALLRWPHRG